MTWSPEEVCWARKDANFIFIRTLLGEIDLEVTYPWTYCGKERTSHLLIEFIIVFRAQWTKFCFAVRNQCVVPQRGLHFELLWHLAASQNFGCTFVKCTCSVVCSVCSVVCNVCNVVCSVVYSNLPHTERRGWNFPNTDKYKSIHVDFLLLALTINNILL